MHHGCVLYNDYHQNIKKCNLKGRIFHFRRILSDDYRIPTCSSNDITLSAFGFPRQQVVENRCELTFGMKPNRCLHLCCCAWHLLDISRSRLNSLPFHLPTHKCDKTNLIRAISSTGSYFQVMYSIGRSLNAFLIQIKGNWIRLQSKALHHNMDSQCRLDDVPSNFYHK